MAINALFAKLRSAAACDNGTAMRVALDATPLTLSSGGLRRYTCELSRALAREFPEDEFLLLSDQAFVMPSGSVANLRASGGPRRGLDRRWWSWGVEREMSRSGADVFHGTDFAVPYLPRRPSVLTLHDLSPWMNPEWHNSAARVRKRTPVLIGLHLATMVLTFSQAVRNQAIESLRIHPSRVATVPHAASELFRPVSVERTGVPYFLFVGTLEPRKNIPKLVEAWREVRKCHAVDLILVGRRRTDFPGLPPADGLRWLGELPDSQLPGLYSGAAAVVDPSCYEGFGLPVLEAMQCGACVITSTDPALVALAGDAALRVAVADAGGMAQAMTAVLAHPELAADLRRRATARARLFSWSRSARLTREVYEEARQRFG
jgi:glycosyltransferase involved in cell wall biosynthesis